MLPEKGSLARLRLRTDLQAVRARLPLPPRPRRRRAGHPGGGHRRRRGESRRCLRWRHSSPMRRPGWPSSTKRAGSRREHNGSATTRPPRMDSHIEVRDEGRVLPRSISSSVRRLRPSRARIRAEEPADDRICPTAPASDRPAPAVEAALTGARAELAAISERLRELTAGSPSEQAAPAEAAPSPSAARRPSDATASRSPSRPVRSVMAGRVPRELAAQSGALPLADRRRRPRSSSSRRASRRSSGGNAEIVGERWQDAAARLRLDPSQRIARALAQRDTWSGQTAWWPVEGSNVRVPAELTALPVFGGDHSFQGYRGFGVLRPAEALMPAAFEARFGAADETAPRPAEQLPPYEEAVATTPANVVPIRADLERLADHTRLTPQERSAFEEIAAALRDRDRGSGRRRAASARSRRRGAPAGSAGASLSAEEEQPAVSPVVAASRAGREPTRQARRRKLRPSQPRHIALAALRGSRRERRPAVKSCPKARRSGGCAR